MTETLAPLHGARLDDTPRTQQDWADPFDELRAASRRMCETAVDSTDIAVMLEIDGINDAIATEIYAARDTHDLAERLLASMPTRAAAFAPAIVGPGDGTHTSARLIGRGVLYAAPGAFYVAIAADFRSEWAGLAVVGATVTGWMVSQIIGLIAHRLTVRTGPANTHAVLRRCIVLTTPAAVGLGLASEPAVGYVAATVLAAQVVFASAAAVLLFYDADHALAYCVIPGAIVAAACALDWRTRWLEWLPPLVAAAAAVLTAIVTAGTAWAVRTAARPTDPPRRVHYPSAQDMFSTLPYVLYGMLCAATLASGPVIDMIGIDRGTPATESGLVVLPIVLVMGYGELEIRRLRASCQWNASISTTMRRYQRRARADLARLELRMAAAFTATTVVTLATIWAISGHESIPLAHLVDSGAYIILGCALIAGLVGCAFARPIQTATTFLVAFGLVATGNLVATPFDLATPTGFLAAGLLLLAAVNVAAIRVVQNPVAIIS